MGNWQINFLVHCSTWCKFGPSLYQLRVIPDLWILWEDPCPSIAVFYFISHILVYFSSTILSFGVSFTFVNTGSMRRASTQPDSRMPRPCIIICWLYFLWLAWGACHKWVVFLGTYSLLLCSLNLFFGVYARLTLFLSTPALRWTSHCSRYRTSLEIIF